MPGVQGGAWTAILVLALISVPGASRAQAPDAEVIPDQAASAAGERPDTEAVPGATEEAVPGATEEAVPATEEAVPATEEAAPGEEAAPPSAQGEAVPPASAEPPANPAAQAPAAAPEEERPAVVPPAEPPLPAPTAAGTGETAPVTGGEEPGVEPGPAVPSLPAPPPGPAGESPGRGQAPAPAAAGSSPASAGANAHGAVMEKEPASPPIAEVPPAPPPIAEVPLGAPKSSAGEENVPPAGSILPEAPGTGKAAPGGLLRIARNLFGKKAEESAPAGAVPSAPPVEEEASEPENQESQRKAKELARFALQNIEKKRISEAKKNINDLITLRPYEADYHLALGLCFRQEKRYKDALKKYQDVLDLGGPKALVNLLRAEVAAVEGEKQKVYEYLKEAAMGGRNIVHDVQNLPHLEKYKSDTEFIKLALYLEKFEIVSKRNQDPFTNPFPASQPAGGQRGPQGVQAGPITMTPQEQQNFLNEARRLYEKVQWYIKLEDEDKAMENYIKLRDIIEKKDLITLPKIANDFRILMGRMETLETQIEGIRLKYYWNQAQTKLKDMKEAFQATEYAKVDSTYTEVEKLSKEMEKSNPRFKPVADRILAAAKVWQNRTNVRREFQSAKPDIQGVIISDEAKLAIVDNKILKQGERFGDFYLQKVENNRLTFRYKGEEIPLIFRRY